MTNTNELRIKNQKLVKEQQNKLKHMQLQNDKLIAASGEKK